MATKMEHKKLYILETFLELGNSIKMNTYYMLVAIQYLSIDEQAKIELLDPAGNEKTEYHKVDQVYSDCWIADQEFKNYVKNNFDELLMPKNN